MYFFPEFVVTKDNDELEILLKQQVVKWYDIHPNPSILNNEWQRWKHLCVENKIYEMGITQLLQQYVNSTFFPNIRELLLILWS